MNEEDVQGRERRTERVRDLETEDSSKVGGKRGEYEIPGSSVTAILGSFWPL